LLCHEVVPLADIQETIHHAVSPRGAVDASLGVSASILQLLQETGNQKNLYILPVGVLSYTERLGREGLGRLFLSAQVVPAADALTGYLSCRAQVTGSFTEEIMPRILATATVGFVQSLPDQVCRFHDPYPLTLISGGLEARVRVTRLIEAGIGTQDFWQKQGNFPPPNTLATEIGYLTLTVRTLPLRF
jgi:hypothetical protein